MGKNKSLIYMNIRRTILILVLGFLTASCSERWVTEKERTPGEPLRDARTLQERGESEQPPSDDQVAEDCLAFVRATKVVSAGKPVTDCLGCPSEGTDLLSFPQANTDAMTCSDDTCTALVTIRAVFNPASGDTLSGGLTGWISPEQRTGYFSGKVPSGEQEYRVKITYKRRAQTSSPSMRRTRMA